MQDMKGYSSVNHNAQLQSAIETAEAVHCCMLERKSKISSILDAYGFDIKFVMTKAFRRLSSAAGHKRSEHQERVEKRNKKVQYDASSKMIRYEGHSGKCSCPEW